MVGVSRAPENQDSNSFSYLLHRQQTADLRRTIEIQCRNKGVAVIVVVSRRKLKKDLERKIFKRSFWKGPWRKPSVTVTTRKCLQATITEVSDYKRTTGLAIIAMERISELFFRVELPKISSLRILRGSHNTMSQNGVFISGASEFNGIHLADWDNRLNDDKELYLGRGVHINPYYGSWRPKSEANETPLPEEQQQEQPVPEGGWWSRWKSVVSGCVGLVVTSAVYAVRHAMSSTWTYIQASVYGITVTAATCTTTTAAPTWAWFMVALLAGALASLAVYYIPWGSVYRWLGRQWRNFYSFLCRFWGLWAEGPENPDAWRRVQPMTAI